MRKYFTLKLIHDVTEICKYHMQLSFNLLVGGGGGGG